MEFHSTVPTMPSVPEDLTIPQFMFYAEHPTKPAHDPTIPWVIEAKTGRKWFGDELRQRSYDLAKGLKSRYNLGENDVVLIFSRNHVDFPVMTWATHLLGGTISGANPEFTVPELVYQIDATKPALLVTYPDCVGTAEKAAREMGIPLDRVVVFNVDWVPTNGPMNGSSNGVNGTHGVNGVNGSASKVAKKENGVASFITVDELVRVGISDAEVQQFEERRLKPGEARTKVAFLNFSSGTTGKPKAVAISHFSYIANMIQLAAHNKVNEEYCRWEDRRFRPGDVLNGVLPFFHSYGLHITLHFCVFNAMTCVLYPKFNYVEMLEGVVRYGITHLMLVPPLIVLLCKHPATEKYDLRRHIRFIMSGAAPLSLEVEERLQEMFPDAHIGQAYGMTETCTINVMWSIDNKRGASGSSGVLLPGITAKIIKSDGSLAGYDEEGEIIIKTPTVTLGYANNAQATKETFIADGWTRTGDIAKITPAGEVHVLDRLKEVMKVKGFQVAPAELEGCLLDHPDVSSACVVGVPDDYSGEVPLAFVVLRPVAAERVEQDPNEAQNIKKSIMQHVAEHKTSYKHLAGGVEFLTSIPTSPSGKLLRRILRERARAMRGKGIPN